tara:strand:- start:652 stop:972 length:321 start_codon:yes stop_codon:yes gene_type:complete
MTEKTTHNAQFRAAVEDLAKVIRKHPGTGGGQVAMKVLTSLAFRVAVPVDLGEVSYHFAHPNDADTLEAVLIAIRFRASCEWPDDIVPDEEIHGWMSKWGFSYELT